MLNKFICICIAFFVSYTVNAQCVGCPKQLTAPGSLAPPSVGFNGFTSEVKTYNGVTPTCYFPVNNTLNGHLQGINNKLCTLLDNLGYNAEKDSIALSVIDSLIIKMLELENLIPNDIGIISSDNSVMVNFSTVGDSTTYDLTLVANSANNGLFKSGTTIKQGGSLIQNTYINGNGQNYSLKKAKGYSINGDTLIFSVGDSTVITQGIYIKKDNNSVLIGSDVFSLKETVDNTYRIGKTINTGANKEGFYVGDRIYSTDASSALNLIFGDSVNVKKSTSITIGIGNNLTIDQFSGDKIIVNIGQSNDIRNENVDAFVFGANNESNDVFARDISGGYIIGDGNTITSALGFVYGQNNKLQNLGSGFIVGGDNLITNKAGGYIFGANDTIIGDNISSNQSALLIGGNIKTSNPYGYMVFNMDNSLVGKVTNSKIATDFANTFTFNGNQYKLYTNTAGTVGVSLDQNDVSWNVMSDSAIKKDFKKVDYSKVYEQFKKTNINTWAMKLDTLGKKRYVGIIAQDFWTLMDKGLGIKTKSKKTISQTNMDGIIMCILKEQAILIEELQEKVRKLSK